MNYIGSKLHLSSFIYGAVTQVVGEDLSSYSFCDLFAGTGAVGKLFQGKVQKIISNDREYYSYVINKAHFNKQLSDYNCLIEELNNLQGIPGFIFNEYSENGKAGRLYFSESNGKKIDAICLKIKQWKKRSVIDEEMYLFLLSILIRGADKVANTASVYASYLKNLKQSARKEVLLCPVALNHTDNTTYEVFQEDSNVLIEKIEGDILYLDPPYNRREYASNYHLLNTIALYDTSFTPKGKTGVRKYATSSYCKKSEAVIALEELISKAHFRYVFLSYNNEGWISSENIRKIMEKYGRYSRFYSVYKRFKSQNTSIQNNITTEFIHILEKY